MDNKCSFFFLLVFSVLSCKQQVVDYESLSGAEIINVDYDKTKTNEDSKDMLFDSISFIKLQTTSKCLIGDIDDLFFIDNTIVVVDKEISKSVFLFDMKGNFKGQVSRLGNGRQEYLNLHDVIITPDGLIAIYDILKDKIMYFDSKGRYKKEQKMSFRFSEFGFIDSTNMVFNIIGSDRNRIYREHTFVVTDSRLKELYFFGNNIQTESFTYRKNHGLYSYGNSTYCTINLGTTIYQVGKDSLKAVYKIDIPDNVTDYSFESDKEFFDLRNKHSFFGDDFLELKDYTVIGYRVPMMGRQFFVYDHETKNTTLLTRNQMQNPLLLFLNSPSAVYKDNVIVQYISSSSLCTYKERIYEELSDDYPQLKELYDGLTVDSNPVLFFYNINLKNEDK